MAGRADKGKQRGGAEPSRLRTFDHQNEPSSGVQRRRAVLGRRREDAASAAATLRMVPSLHGSPGAYESLEYTEQSFVRARNADPMALLPSVIVTPEPPPPLPGPELDAESAPTSKISAPPRSGPRAIDPRSAPTMDGRELVAARLAPTNRIRRRGAMPTFSSIRASSVVVLLAISLAVFAVGLATLLLGSPFGP